MGEKALTERIVQGSQAFRLRMVTEIKASRILQDQDPCQAFDPLSGCLTLGLDNPLTVTTWISEKGIGRFGCGPITTEFRNGGPRVLTEIVEDFQ